MTRRRMTRNVTRSIQLVKSIHHALQRNKFVQATTPLLLALSGGQDSMALLALFLQLKNQRKYKVGLCWCHHLWRCDAFQTMHHLMRLSFTVEEPIYFILEPTTDPSLPPAKRASLTPLERTRPPAPPKERKREGRRRRLLTFYASLLGSKRKGGKRSSTEEAARSWRYQSCQRLATFHRYRIIQVGHTASDRIETSLFQLLRGSGMKGVAAIQWNRVIRPLYPKQFSFSNFYGITFEKFE